MKISDAVQLQESRRPKLTDVLRVDESVLVMGDVEIPFHNHEFINNCIAYALSHGIRAVLYAGDLFQFSAFSSFPLSEKDSDKEIEEIGDFILPLIRPFERVFYIAGNHDARPSRLMDRVLRLDQVARLVVPPEYVEEWTRKVKTSDKYHAYVGDDWLIVHPRGGTTVPANAARMIAGNRHVNVAMAHNHLVGLQQASDNCWGVEIGCCVDPERLHYYMDRLTTRPMMRNGALILYKQGDGSFIPELLSPGLTRFSGGADEGQRGTKRKDGRRRTANDR